MQGDDLSVVPSNKYKAVLDAAENEKLGEKRFSGKPPAPCPPHALPPRPRHTTSHSHSTGF